MPRGFIFLYHRFPSQWNCFCAYRSRGFSMLSKFSRQAPGLLPLLACAAILFCFSTAVFAQSDLATIRGVVTDQSGASVPNAKVVLTNKETNASREIQTSDSGEFELPFLNQGTYRLTATGTGFKTFVADDVLVRAREIR